MPPPVGHLHGGDVADGELGAGGDLLLGLEHGRMDVRPSVIEIATHIVTTLVWSEKSHQGISQEYFMLH